MQQKPETKFASQCGVRLQSGFAEHEVDQVKKID